MDFDLEKLKQEQDAVNEEKRRNALVGAMADRLSNQQSFGNFFTGKMNQSDGSGARTAQALNESIADPIERQSKILAQYRAHKEAKKADRADAEESSLSSAESPETQALYESFAQAGVRVKPGLSGKQILSAYGKPAEFALAKFKEEQERKTALAKKSSEIRAGKQLPADKVLNVNEGNTLPATLGDIRQTLEANKDEFGPVAGRLSSINPWNEKAKTIDAQMRSSAQAFGRYMEGGVLRKEDEEKYLKMFPTLSDTPGVAKNKLDLVERLLTSRQKSNVDALAGSGYDTSGVTKNLSVPDVPSVIAGGKKAVSHEAHAGAEASFDERDTQALEWARANPKDPRAQAIVKRLKSRGLY